jgi:hypothetical protein
VQLPADEETEFIFLADQNHIIIGGANAGWDILQPELHGSFRGLARPGPAGLKQIRIYVKLAGRDELLRAIPSRREPKADNPPPAE